MDRKIILFLLLSLFLISFASAILTSYPDQRQDTDITLKQTCVNSTYSNITAITLGNGRLLNISQNMNRYANSFYNYTLLSGNTTSIGTYSVDGICDENGIAEAWNYAFKVTRTGNNELSQGSATLYIVLFGVFLFLFVLIIYGIQKLPSGNIQDFDGKIMKISWAKYLRGILWLTLWMFVVALFYLSANLSFAYLEDELVANFMFALYRVTMGLTIPIIIVWTVFIFAKLAEDKQFWGMLKRGIFPQGKI